jgi:hypothetical protein
MKSKPTPFFSSATFVFFLMLLALPSAYPLFAQTSIFPQKLGYPMICANIPNNDYPNGYNRYEVAFKISGFSSTENFIVLLSSDNFANVVKPKIIPNDATTPADTPTDKTLTFEVPADLVGSNTYKIRVQSQSGVTSADFRSSDLQSSFPIHFLSYSGQFFINNQSSALSFCFGGSVTLAIDNVSPSLPKSPLQYPQLKYIWYKNGTAIPNENKSTLSVNQGGDYYVEIDYGPCTDLNTHSQIVKVGGASGSTATITSSLGNPFCSSLGNTALTVDAGNSYVWRKDDVVIDGAISQTYQANLPGLYTCDVDFGGCKSKGTIDLKVLTTNSSISGVDVEKVNYITEGETLKAVITTASTTASFEWFLNDVVIPGADKNFLDITAVGKYKGVITENTGCIITDEFPFEVSFKTDFNVPKISNILTPEHTWIIPNQYTGGQANVMILNSYGEIVFQTNNYVNDNGWPQTSIEFKNFNPVYYYIITPTSGSAKKGSITLVK